MISQKQSCVIVAMALLAGTFGCATSKLQGKKDFTSGTIMSRPGRVLVRDFRANLEEVEEGEIKGQRELYREAREALSEQLVARIRAMGLIAKREPRSVKANPGELIVDGEFVSIDKGNRFTRSVIGFGVGATEMVAQVQVKRGIPDSRGNQMVFDFRVVSKGSKKPGIATPVGMGATAVAAVSGAVGVVGEVKGPVTQDAIRMADAVADDLASWFVEQGWVPEEAIEK
jgi:hypothetical protein